MTSPTHTVIPELFAAGALPTMSRYLTTPDDEGPRRGYQAGLQRMPGHCKRHRPCSASPPPWTGCSGRPGRFSMARPTDISRRACPLPVCCA